MNNIDHAWAVELKHIKGLAGKYYWMSILDSFNDRPRTALFATKKICKEKIKERNIDGKPVKVQIIIRRIK